MKIFGVGRFTYLMLILFIQGCSGGSGPDISPDAGNETIDLDQQAIIDELLADLGSDDVSSRTYPHQGNFFGDQDLSLFYEFFHHDHVNTIEVRVQQDEWDAFIEHFTNDEDSDQYFKSNVLITTASGPHQMIEEVGFRIRGNTTRTVPDGEQAHFKLKFNKRFEDLVEGTEAYQERKDRRFANMRALNLKSRGIADDVSQMRELYAYDLFNQAGLFAPVTASVQLYITVIAPNGGEDKTNFGMYTGIEMIDKSFLRKRYGKENNDGNLYKCLWQDAGPATLTPKPSKYSERRWMGVKIEEEGINPTYALKTNEEEADHTAFKSFIENLNNLSGDELKTYMDKTFEVERFLKVVALNVLIGMPDDYWAMGNNYYLYFNNNGKIEFIPYDYDHSFAGGWYPFDTVRADIYEWHDLNAEFGKDYGHPLVDKLLDIPDYLAFYKSTMAEVIDENTGIFNYQAFNKTFYKLKYLYDPDGNGRVDNDFYQNTSMTQSLIGSQSGLRYIEEYFDEKIESVKSQL